MLKYTEDHEWLRAEGDEVVVGITSHAAEQLGDVVYVELPEIGREVEAGEEIVVIESVKAASEIMAPLDGTITAVLALLFTGVVVVMARRQDGAGDTGLMTGTSWGSVASARSAASPLPVICPALVTMHARR